MDRVTLARFNWLICEEYWKLEGRIENYDDSDPTFPLKLYNRMLQYSFPNETINKNDFRFFQKSHSPVDFFYENITLDKNVDWIRIVDRKKDLLPRHDIDIFYIKAGLFFTYGYIRWEQKFTLVELRLIYVVLFEEDIDSLDITTLREYLEKSKMDDTIKETKDLIKKLEKYLGCQNQQSHKRRTERVESVIMKMYDRISSESLAKDLGLKEGESNE